MPTSLSARRVSDAYFIADPYFEWPLSWSPLCLQRQVFGCAFQNGSILYTTWCTTKLHIPRNFFQSKAPPCAKMQISQGGRREPFLSPRTNAYPRGSFRSHQTWTRPSYKVESAGVQENHFNMNKKKWMLRDEYLIYFFRNGEEFVYKPDVKKSTNCLAKNELCQTPQKFWKLCGNNTGINVDAVRM